ncbi:MAG: hypothetical protein HXN28_07840 [Prevotella histicola]|uniref:hypothetical protein n=1 Tax=Prevotella histicola TaxID=470565 RepID=UPI001CB5CF28|nr:hypothetical protein [Prevotella histicola]MBF1392468.1 hypothetical protein [Prevotella histicola]
MKKTLITFALLLTVTVLNAQTLIKINLKKGDKAVYENVSTVNVALPMGAGNQNIKITNTTTVEVKDATADGFKVEFLTKDSKIEGNEEAAQQFGDQLSRYLDGVPALFQTDKNGCLQKLLNYEEVVGKMSKVAITQIDSMYKKNPKIEEMAPKAKVIMALNDLFTEKNIMENFKNKSVFQLYGKTLKTGDKEDKEIQGIKVNTTYDVSNVLGMLTVVAKSKANMTENETKAFFISNLKKMGMGEEISSQFEQNWGQMKAMGMASIDMNDTTTYHFTKSGWVNDVVSSGKMKMMGMQMDLNTSVKLVSDMH